MTIKEQQEKIYILDNDYLEELQEMFLLNGIEPQSFHGYMMVTGMTNDFLTNLMLESEWRLNKDDFVINVWREDGSYKRMDLLTFDSIEN